MPHLRFDVDVPRVLFDNGVDGGEAEAGAGLLGREIRVEDPRHMVGLDAFAGVADRDLNVIARREARHGVVGQRVVARRDAQRAATGHGLDGVDHDVLHHAADLALVGVGRPEVRRQVERGLHLRTMQRKGGHLAHDGVEPHRGAHRFPALGKREELLREIARPQRRLLRRAQARGGRRVGRDVELGERQVAHDRREDVVEIMRDAAGEDADGLQPGRADQLLLEAVLVGHVAKHEHGPDHLAVDGMDGRTTALDHAALAGARDEPGLRRQVHHHVAPRDARHRQVDPFGSPRVLDAANLRHGVAAGLALVPAGQRRRRRVHELHDAVDAGGDDRLAHGPQGDGQALLLRGQRRLRPPLGRDVGDDADQFPVVGREGLDGDLLVQPDILPGQAVAENLLVARQPPEQRLLGAHVHLLGLRHRLRRPRELKLRLRVGIPSEEPAEQVGFRREQFPVEGPVPHPPRLALPDHAVRPLQQRRQPQFAPPLRLLGAVLGGDVGDDTHQVEHGRLHLDHRDHLAQPDVIAGVLDVEFLRIPARAALDRLQRPVPHDLELRHLHGMPVEFRLVALAENPPVEHRALCIEAPLQRVARQQLDRRLPDEAVRALQQVGQPGLALASRRLGFMLRRGVRQHADQAPDRIGHPRDRHALVKPEDTSLAVDGAELLRITGLALEDRARAAVVHRGLVGQLHVLPETALRRIHAVAKQQVGELRLRDVEMRPAQDVLLADDRRPPEQTLRVLEDALGRELALGL